MLYDVVAGTATPSPPGRRRGTPPSSSTFTRSGTFAHARKSISCSPGIRGSHFVIDGFMDGDGIRVSSPWPR